MENTQNGSTAVAVNGNNSLATQEYFITRPGDSLQLANVVAGFVKEKGLSSKISNNEYVRAEGWQFAGLNLGLLPIVHEPERIPCTDDEIKYKCYVELVDPSGVVRGGGYAICSNRESTKKSFNEYAIYSMTQTRAIGKAYRNTIAWLMKAAGFEATPYEEMTELEKQKSPESKAQALSPAEVKKLLQDAENDLAKAKNREDVRLIWNKAKYAGLKKNDKFLSLIKENTIKFPDESDNKEILPGDVVDFKNIDAVKAQLENCKTKDQLEELYDAISKDENFESLSDAVQQSLYDTYTGKQFDFEKGNTEAEEDTKE